MSGGEAGQIEVLVDHETLEEHAAGRSEFVPVPWMPAEMARRLSCDGSHVNIIENDQREP